MHGGIGDVQCKAVLPRLSLLSSAADLKCGGVKHVTKPTAWLALLMPC